MDFSLADPTSPASGVGFLTSLAKFQFESVCVHPRVGVMLRVRCDLFCNRLVVVIDRLYIRLRCVGKLFAFAYCFVCELLTFICESLPNNLNDVADVFANVLCVALRFALRVVFFMRCFALRCFALFCFELMIALVYLALRSSSSRGSRGSREQPVALRCLALL